MEPESKPSSRRGLRLIEDIAILAVVVFIAVLALPAIQSSRESSREAMCKDNLRKIALGLQQYHESFNYLPINMGPWDSSSFGSISSDHGDLNGKGWIVSILPQLDQQSLYDQFTPGFNGSFHMGKGIRAKEIQDAVKTQIAVLQCPSDPSVRELSTTQWQWLGTPVATTSYKGVMGDSQVGGPLSTHEGSMPDCHMYGECNGLFYRVTFREPQSFKDVKDALASTFLVGEEVPEHNNHSAAYYSNSDWASCAGPLNFFPDPPRPDDWFDVFSFRSRHQGGAHFAMADGSVHFVSEKIEHPLYRALSTKAGGEEAAVPE
jgi:prepilin-type processing-associated H-X9-DG protein